ncbi:MULTISPECIES: SGNH/GDSL hydrolase family protein [unclassified Bradyrhizobium]|uniref:SGNH/GDSL hydrolase family protein n=1 Tax=unclassified Bradyrhizobium TaxID=2631580 RepID=UPI0024797AA7|nr:MULTISPECIES: SGNH/GDSL hydrolase family protein [unclassified Bradyrhizobium]WGS19697.1 SGNH/GDSL hydrolase family protein [Bradyrhizobium sp. ISRA463]WGS26542.1 SGNH/GDSL hydrolase family protein [Bradyrhizobium sp. ISRA464]
MTKRIMCFGDSLTWGWIVAPETSPTRFPYHQRWTGVMAARLGAGYEIIEEGLSGRTTSIDDPVDPGLNGSAYLPIALASHRPLDLVIILLGTNDTKSDYRRTPHDIAIGMSELVAQVLASGTAYRAPKVLIVAPPPLAALYDSSLESLFEGSREKTLALASHYKALANSMKVDFFDAGGVISTGGADGIHFSAENNADLGAALAEKVAAILAS